MSDLTNFDPNAAAAAGSGVYGLPFSHDNSRVILVPVPYEATTSYGGGTSRGPGAIREASHQVDLYDLGTGKPYEAGIFMLDESEEIWQHNEEAKHLATVVIHESDSVDAPTLAHYLAQVNEHSAAVNQWVYQTTARILAENRIAGIVGGDHSVPFGAIQAYAEKYPGLGILHIDAHADLRDSYEGFTWSHASIMHNVMTRIPAVGKLVQVGIRDFCEAEKDMIDQSNGRIVTFFDEQLAARKFEGTSWGKLVAEMVAALPQQVYLSFDIDGLDPTLCPNTGTPVPGGLSFQEAVALIAAVAHSGRTIVGFDLNEVAPGADDEWDANVGARMLYKMIGYTLLSQG
ncbi:MAG: agmatinase family protein [Blastocatellia bacterium]|nr:agmatinase family protein [Blastocatellia bacterium]